MARKRTKPGARDRIVETAERLFYAEGIRAVGIDRIIAEAGVAKMSLYNHFKSKDDLVLAVLQYREQTITEYFESAIDRYVEEGSDRLDAFFSALKEWFGSRGFRGCAFINAMVELADAKHPASTFARHHKEIFHQMIGSLMAATYGAKAEPMVPAVSMIVEGAIVTAVMEGNAAAADVARDATRALLSAKRRK